MFDIFIKKSAPLAKMDAHSVNTSEQNRLTVLKFSQSLLFLAGKESFRQQSLSDFKSHIAQADIGKFVLGYTYLVTNGFPKNIKYDGFVYKDFEEILADVTRNLSSSDDPDQIKRFAEIVHLLLLNPKLNSSCKFSIEQAKPDKMAIEHIFSMWVESRDETKKQILADLLVHFIAITPDLSAITPNAKPYCAYILSSLVTYNTLKRYLDKTNLLSWTISLVDIFDIVPVALYWTTAISAGYFMTLHIMDIVQTRGTEGKLSIDPDYLIGTFALGKPFVLKPPTILKNMNDKFVDGRVRIGVSYAEDYIYSKLLLTKYAATKTYLRSARADIKFQLDLEELTKRYNSLTAPQELIFEGDQAAAFTALVQRTFNEANFNAICKELKDLDKRKYFLQIYEMVEKGFIKIDLQTMYVMNEVFNQACLSGYESSLTRMGKVLENSLTFESFQYSVDTLLAIRHGAGIPLSTLGSCYNNCTTELLKCYRKLDLQKLESTRQWVLGAFDDQYLFHKLATKSVIETKIEIGEVLADLDAIFDTGVNKFKKLLSQKWNENQGLLNSLKLLGGTVSFTGFAMIMLKPSVRPLSLLFMVVYTADHYHHPQIIGLKECGQKLCSDGYSTGNDVYKGLTQRIGSCKSYISSYIMSKNSISERRKVSV